MKSFLWVIVSVSLFVVFGCSSTQKFADRKVASYSQIKGPELEHNETVQALLVSHGFLCGDVQSRSGYGRDIDEPTDTDNDTRNSFDKVGRNCSPGTKWLDPGPDVNLDLAVTVTGEGFQLGRDAATPMKIVGMTMHCDRDGRIDGVYKGSFWDVAFGAGGGRGNFVRDHDGAECKLKWKVNGGMILQKGSNIVITVKPFRLWTR